MKGSIMLSLMIDGSVLNLPGSSYTPMLWVSSSSDRYGKSSSASYSSWTVRRSSPKKQQQDSAYKAKREAALPRIVRRRHRVLSRSAEYKTSGWLTTLPSTDNNTGLDVAQFRDALTMRYGRHPPGLVARWDHCNQPLTVDHALCCKRYGLVICRHNELRDTFDGGVRADIVARGVWEWQAAPSFDICITDVDAPSYASKN